MSEPKRAIVLQHDPDVDSEATTEIRSPDPSEATAGMTGVVEHSPEENASETPKREPLNRAVRDANAESWVDEIADVNMEDTHPQITPPRTQACKEIAKLFAKFCKETEKPILSLKSSSTEGEDRLDKLYEDGFEVVKRWLEAITLQTQIGAVAGHLSYTGKAQVEGDEGDTKDAGSQGDDAKEDSEVDNSMDDVVGLKN